MLMSSLLAVMSQRLVRLLCLDCREATQATQAQLELIGLADRSDVTVYRAKGC